MPKFGTQLFWLRRLDVVLSRGLARHAQDSRVYKMEHTSDEVCAICCRAEGVIVERFVGLWT